MPRRALATPFRGGTVQDLAKEMLALADAGLRARERLDWAQQDESVHVQTLKEIAETGRTPAEEKLDLFHGRWNRTVDPIFAEFPY